MQGGRPAGPCEALASPHLSQLRQRPLKVRLGGRVERCPFSWCIFNYKAMRRAFSEYNELSEGQTVWTLINKPLYYVIQLLFACLD